MELVAIGGLLSLTLDRQWVIIMVISMIFFFWILDGEI
jgi:preprotein translocase subunit SecE